MAPSFVNMDGDAWAIVTDHLEVDHPAQDKRVYHHVQELAI
jgi:hypothetical protein